MRIYDLEKRYRKYIDNDINLKDIDIHLETDLVVYSINNQVIYLDKIKKLFNTLKDKNIKATFSINVLE